MTSSVRRLGDDVLVRRAARGVALQAAGLVAAAMLLIVVLVVVVVVRGQASSADRLLRSTAATADDVVDPPPGAWLVLSRDGQLASSPGLPPSVGAVLGRLRARATGQPALVTLAMDDRRSYRVATQQRSGRTIQVVLDLTPEHLQRMRLLRAMLIAYLLGLVFAVALGVLLARRAVRPLAQALALQRTFIADASHELRTPLTLLSTRAQVLDRAVQGSGLERQVRDDSRGVVNDVQRLAEVVEDLLLAADPRDEVPHQPTELAGLVESVVDSAGAHAAQADVDLTLTVDGDTPRWVLGSAPALRRAVLALVDNAIDHTPPNGEVCVRTRHASRSAIVSVTDTGPGLAPATAQDVLQRFHSGGHRSGRAHYGLGLALANDVANRHGGQLRLVDVSVGASFELVLPDLLGRP